jgi:hypothetical protein
MKNADWEINGEWRPFNRLKDPNTVRAAPLDSSGRGAHDDDG